MNTNLIDHDNFRDDAFFWNNCIYIFHEKNVHDYVLSCFLSTRERDVAFRDYKLSGYLYAWYLKHVITYEAWKVKTIQTRLIG